MDIFLLAVYMMMIQWNIYIVYNWCEMIIEDLQRLGSCCTYLAWYDRRWWNASVPYNTLKHGAICLQAILRSNGSISLGTARLHAQPAESKHGRPSPSSSFLKPKARPPVCFTQKHCRELEHTIMRVSISVVIQMRLRGNSKHRTSGACLVRQMYSARFSTVAFRLYLWIIVQTLTN